MNTTKAYEQMLGQILTRGRVVSPRGLAIRELEAYRITTNPLDNVITTKGLETNTGYALEELAWYLKGDYSIGFSPKIKRIWEQYSDDGKTVNSNYGARIYGRDERFGDQWRWVVNKLKADPSTRQAVMTINAPCDKERATKDFPCTMSLQALVRDDKLDWVTHMRSNDAYLGYRNDMFCFTMLQRYLAAEVGVGLGVYHHVANSMHVYEGDVEKIEKALNISCVDLYPRTGDLA